MNIALDATESFWPVLTGTGVYTRELVRHLLPIAAPDHLTVLGIRADNLHTDFVPPHQLRLLRSPRYRSLWSQIRLPLHLLNHRYDLLHVPGHKLPALSPCPRLATIHDLAFLKFPETFQPLHRQRLVWFTQNAVRRSDRLIAISESTKRDLCELLRAAPEKITVIPHGVDRHLFHPGVAPAARPHPYLLSVGTLQPRKNYELLIRAFNELCRRHRDPVELLIAGQRGWLCEPIEHAAAQSPFAHRIHLLGYVPDPQLAALYRGAHLVAQPSLYEGFGIPLVEAMACGAPVVAANASAFPEVVGPAGILLDPRDQDAWTTTFLSLLESPAQRAELSRQALARSAHFTWERTARETLAVYRA
jgi:glycosyltransferase involved in cell wall biosynthesis